MLDQKYRYPFFIPDTPDQLYQLYFFVIIESGAGLVKATAEVWWPKL